MGANPIKNDDPLFIRMIVSRLGVAKRWAQDLLYVDPAELLAHGARHVVGETSQKGFAIFIKNTIKHNVRCPLWLKRIA
jgi:hypothetical protein